MGQGVDSVALNRLHAQLPVLFAPCPVLSESTTAAPMAVQSEPFFPLTMPLPAGLSGPLYVSIHGENRYCFYRVDASAAARPVVPTSTHYGAPAQLRDALPRHLPVGVFIDERGLGYAESLNTGEWYVVGAHDVVTMHFQALLAVAAQGLYRYDTAATPQWRQRSAVFHTVGNDPSHSEPIPLPVAHRLWGEWLTWAGTEPDGVLDVSPLLAGTPVAYDPLMRSAEAIYDKSLDQVKVASALLQRIEDGQYHIVRSIIRHEWTHQQLLDQGARSPIGDIVRSGIALLSDLVCPEWNGCAGANFLPYHRQEIIRGLLRQNSLSDTPVDVPSEGIAYTMQLAEAELLPEEPRTTIETLYVPLLERVLGLMHEGHVPAVVFRLSRDYFSQGLTTMLDQLGLAGEMDRFTAAYDEHLACAEGDRAACARVRP